MFVIGICGGSASGKSVLADTLSLKLGKENTLILKEDNYYRNFSHETTDFDTVNYDLVGAKEHDLLAKDITTLKSGQEIKLFAYDFTKHERMMTDQTAQPPKYLIIEGIHALSDTLRPSYDLSVFIDTPHHVRLARRLIRDVSERGRDFDEVVNRYMSMVRPAYDDEILAYKDKADLVFEDNANAVLDLAACIACDFMVDTTEHVYKEIRQKIAE